MRGISEIVSMLVLLGATMVAFIGTLVVVPQYFQRYDEIAMQASYSQELPGYQTTASLAKASGAYLIPIIYNNGDKSVKISFYIYCENSTKHIIVVKQSNVLIPPHRLYTKVFHADAKGMVCYLVVEEPHLLIYKVSET